MGNLVDLFSLDGKVALVTGAGSGLGRQFSEVALFLASAASDYLTGQTLVTDGGCLAK